MSALSILLDVHSKCKNLLFSVIITIDKYWFCRLSPNHKVLHYGDCEENDTPSTDQLASKCEFCYDYTSGINPYFF